MEKGILFQRTMWDEVGYKPSEEQLEFHESTAPIRLVAGGVRGGKSFSLAHECHRFMLEENGLLWLVGPSYEHCRPEFGYLLDAYQKVGLLDPESVSFPAKGPCRFKTVWGFEVLTKSSSDPVSLSSYAPNLVAMCEAAQQTYDAYMKCIERSTEKHAPVILSGTFESSLGWYAELWEEFQGENPSRGRSFSIPTWSNKAKFPEGRDSPAIKQAENSMPPDLFQERYGGIPCKPRGLVFPEFEYRKHVKKIEHLFNPQLPVEVWVDPAAHTYSVLFVQLEVTNFGTVVKILDEVYEHETIAQRVIPTVISTPWWEHSCYNGVIDISAKTRAMGGRSQIEVWETELMLYETHSVSWSFNKVMEEEWRNAIKLRLAPPENPDKPLILFSDKLPTGVRSDGLANGIIGEIQTYRWAPIDGAMRNLPRRPIKKNEDALSALGYGLFSHFGPVIQRRTPHTSKKRHYWV